MELFEIIALIMIGVFLIGMRMFMCDPFEEQNRKTLHRRLISSYKSYLHEKTISLLTLYLMYMLKMNEDKGLDYVNTKIYHDILFDEIYDLFYEYNIDVEKVFIAGLNDVVVKKWYGYNLDNDIIDNFFELLITDIENSDIRIDEVEYE